MFLFFSLILLILGEVGWEWEEEDVFAGVGSFKALFRNIEQGFFCPVVKQIAKKRKARKINDLRSYYASLEGRIIEEDEEVQTEEMKEIPIPFEDWSVDVQVNVEIHLRSVCRKLWDSFKGRLKAPPLALRSMRIFNNSFNWFDQNEEEGEGMEESTMPGPSTATVPTPTNLSTGTKILQPLKKRSPEYFQQNWDRIVEGFIEFARVASELSEESLEFKYQVFKEKCGTEAKSKVFCLLFEWIQLKSFSEAYAETVGSIMVVSTAKGKHVQRENLGKNICLNFNLPPLHILDESFVKELADDLVRKKELRFFRKLEVKRPSWVKKLKNSNLSSSIHNFREEKEKKNMRLPLKLFRAPVQSQDPS